MRSAAISNNRTVMKPAVFLLSLLLAVVFLSACGASGEIGASRNTDPVPGSDSLQGSAASNPPEADPAEPHVPDGEINGDESKESTEEPIVTTLKMKIDGQEVSVVWEDNESVRALISLASETPVTVPMSMYGGFEQVGPLGTSIPANDAQTVTQPGDIVLYAGDRIVVFYGSNSWAYTRLGKISGLSEEELRGILGSGDVTLTVFAAG